MCFNLVLHSYRAYIYGFPFAPHSPIKFIDDCSNHQMDKSNLTQKLSMKKFVCERISKDHMPIKWKIGVSIVIGNKMFHAESHFENVNK